MPRPSLSFSAITPQQAGWDATVQDGFDAIKTFVAVQPYAPPVFTIASGAGQLPAAADYQNCIAMVSDPTSGKSPLVYSDATNWRYVGDDSVAL